MANTLKEFFAQKEKREMNIPVGAVRVKPCKSENFEISTFEVDEEKVKIICGDVFTPQDYLAQGTKFDRLYFDIWDTICADNYPQMKDLNVKWRKYKAPGGKAYFWEKEYCKRSYLS